MEHVPKLLNSALAFRGDDAAFAELMKERVTDLVSVLVIELESGFGNYADAQKFVKANVDELLTVASEPKNAKLTVMMGSPAIVGFFNKCHENSPQLVAKEEVKAQLAEEKLKPVAETLAQRYARQLAQDKPLI